MQAMKKILLASFILISIVTGVARVSRTGPKKTSTELRDGDIIFQSSKSGQSWAIQLATHSKYSHVGMIYHEDGEAMVFEAVQPVKITPLKEFIRRGDGNHYVVKRLKGDRLSDTDLANMREYGEQFIGYPYDLYFEWSDDKMYCSELVWKVYKYGAGVEIGSRQKLGDFDLSHEVVKKIIKERYGSNVPLDEDVISPGAMFDSPLLVEVMKK
jgi:uncharacterized protein YycO